MAPSIQILLCKHPIHPHESLKKLGVAVPTGGTSAGEAGGDGSVKLTGQSTQQNWVLTLLRIIPFIFLPISSPFKKKKKKTSTSSLCFLATQGYKAILEHSDIPQATPLKKAPSHPSADINCVLNF